MREREKLLKPTFCFSRYIVGGLDRESRVLCDTWRLNLRTWRWEALGAGPFAPRSGAQLVSDAHHLLLIGGAGKNGESLSDCWSMAPTVRYRQPTKKKEKNTEKRWEKAENKTRQNKTKQKT